MCTHKQQAQKCIQDKIYNNGCVRLVIRSIFRPTLKHFKNKDIAFIFKLLAQKQMQRCAIQSVGDAKLSPHVTFSFILYSAYFQHFFLCMHFSNSTV